MTPATCQGQLRRFLLLASPSPSTDDADDAAFLRTPTPTTHLALAWSFHTRRRRRRGTTLRCVISRPVLVLSSPSAHLNTRGYWYGSLVAYPHVYPHPWLRVRVNGGYGYG